MKKIYMILAAMSLLSLSLNAQVDIQTKAKPASKSRLAAFNFNEMLRGIKGMESILSVSGSANGQLRAPRRYDASLFNTLGPFTGDNFDYGIGFPEAYPDDYQDILVTTVLNRNEYESHIGEEIVGFRFALWGDATKTVKVSDFITYPYNSNSGFDQNHLYEWALTDLEGNEPPSGDDPTEITKYVKVTSSSDLTNGEYLIVCETQNVIFDGGTTTLNGTNYATAPTISNGAIEYTEDLDGKDFTIDMSNGTVKSASGYYIGCESGNNVITFNQNTQYTNTITVNDGTASIVYRYNNANRPLKCNTQTNVFRYYKTTSSGVADIQLYKKVAVTRSMAPRRANRATLEKTICDGTNTNAYLPVYGLYVDNNYQVNQVIYPASELTDLVGQTITSMTFYTEANIGANLGGSTWTVKLGTTTQSTFASSLSSITRVVPSDVVTVASGIHLPTGSNTMTITFSTPFTYTGNNLLVDFEETAYTSNYASTYFYGVNQPTGTYTGFNSYGTSLSNGHYGSGGGRAFLPKVTFTYEGDSNDGYAILEPGQWHEFYLDHPETFNVDNDDDQLFIGYRYKQYPLSKQDEEVINPAAVNSQSTGHSHFVNMVAGSDGAGDLVITLPGSTMNVASITVYDTNGNTLTSWNATTAYNNGDYTQVTIGSNNRISYNLPTGWSIASGNYFLAYSSDNTNFYGYLYGAGDITIASSALNGNTTVRVVINGMDDNGNVTVSVNGQGQTIGDSQTNYTWNNVDLSATVYNRSWFNPDFSQVGDLAVQLIFKSKKPTPAAPVVTNVVNDNNVAITITPDENTDGDLVYYVIDKDGNQTQDLTFPRGDTDYTVTVHAYTTATDNYNESPEATQTVTIPALPQTATPVINVEPGDEAYTITATGDGTVTMVVNGTEYHGEGSVTVTIDRGAENQTVVVTATAQETGKRVSDEATQTVTVPYLITEAPVITIERTNEGVIVTATGNGNVTLTVGDQPSQSGQGSVSITLPYGDNEYTVTATATAQETGKHVSDATSKDVVVSPIDETWSEFTGTYSDDDVINWGKEVMFVDRFSEQLHPSNDHPAKYEYTLVENKDEGKSTNEQIVPVQKPRDVMGGFFTRSQVDNDYDLKLPVDVMNADMEVYLENSNDIYYYAVNRGVNEAPDTVLSKMQRVYNNTYTEIGKYFFNETFSSGIKSRLDTIDVKTGKYGFETGTFNEDYMSYVPIIWTFGHLRTNRRVNFTNDSIHNSYGAPVWYTGVGKVDDFKGEVQRQKGKWSVWTAPDGKPCARFRAHIEAKGYLPTEGHDSINVEYEPYMFRIWVVCDSLRDYTVNSETGYLEDAGAYPSDTMWLADVPCYRIIDGNTTLYDSYLNYGDVDKQDEYVNQLMFGANQGAKPTFIVRFYYRAKAKELPGEEETPETPAGMMMRQLRSEANAYYAVEDEFDPGDPTVGINEIGLINNATVVNTIYYNAQGMSSNQPFEGFNIIVTRYSDGSTTTDKVFK